MYVVAMHPISIYRLLLYLLQLQSGVEMQTGSNSDDDLQEWGGVDMATDALGWDFANDESMYTQTAHERTGAAA
jgi:hypothetical protein